MIELLYHTAKSFLGIFAYGKILAAGRSVALGLKKIWIDDLGATFPYLLKIVAIDGVPKNCASLDFKHNFPKYVVQMFDTKRFLSQ